MISFEMVNNTGYDKVFYYILGTDLTKTNRPLGYVDANGTFHNWPNVGSRVPVDAPDVSIENANKFKLPNGFSGRIYYSVNEKLNFKVVMNDLGVTGLVQPAPWVSVDSSAETYFDWAELTIIESQMIWINSTQVDQMAIPAKVEVFSQDGSSQVTGVLKPGGFQHVVNELSKLDAWKDTVVRNAEGKVLRVLNPSHATIAGRFDEHYLDDYIEWAWNQYQDKDLVIVPFSHEPQTKFYGRTANNRMTFKDGNGKVVAAFDKPKSIDVWACDGNLNGVGNAYLPNDHTTGPISRTLAAALNRGTLGRFDVEPQVDQSLYYQDQGGTANLYAKFVHEAMDNGRAYAFAFDDVGGNESLVHDQNPERVVITLQDIQVDGIVEPSEPTPGDPVVVDPAPVVDPDDPVVDEPVVDDTVVDDPVVVDTDDLVIYVPVGNDKVLKKVTLVGVKAIIESV